MKSEHHSLQLWNNLSVGGWFKSKMEPESMKMVAWGGGFTSDFPKRFPLSYLPLPPLYYQWKSRPLLGARGGACLEDAGLPV